VQNKSIYEMICRQELVKKELLESKKNFSDSWATSPTVKTLAGLIYEEDEERIAEALSEVVNEVPYFAFVTKGSLHTALKSSLMISESVQIPDDHLRKYTSILFEMKKPIKNELVTILNEKYGINVQNLKEAPSFKSLINTQVVVLETIARISPKKSTQKRVLREFVEVLKQKSGVQSIEVNDCLRLIFEQANITTLFEDDELINQWEGDLGMDVEQGYENLSHIEYDPEEVPLAEAEDEEAAEEAEETPPGQKPDPMEEDPEDEDEEANDEEGKEVSKEEFREAMKDLEDLLSDISPETPDDETLH